ncbi:MAG: DNA repair protein RecN [Chloroflexi bacterium]|nr:DNA repair protein RecN [Chloroflexota bacterium]
MLAELSITDFAIIDQLRLTFAPGLQVLTGETGAGKSIIVDAVSLLLGGRAAADGIRAGADRAYVEGIFSLENDLPPDLAPLLEELGIGEGDGTLILSREISRRGRNICRVNGRAVPLKTLQAVAESLVDIHGQTDHLSLLRVRNHVDLLDRYAGTEARRKKVARRVRDLRAIRQSLAELLRDERELARRTDLLEYQIAEIEDAQLDIEEEKQLRQERRRLENAARLAELADSSYNALRAANDGGDALLDRLEAAARDLATLVSLEPEMAPQHESAEQAFYALEDVADTLLKYRDAIEFNPSRLEQVEDRLDLLFQLKRKYGDTIADVLAFAERARAEREAITHSAERIDELRAAEELALQEIGEWGGTLSALRQQASAELAEAVEKELDDLGMSVARFQVRIAQQQADDGAPWEGRRYAFDATGLDKVEFFIAPNPGEPPKPLAKIASGGETSRLMLALKTVLSQADETATLIFDEIDQGIGGRIGGIVGRKLGALARHHQVFCITHLPQIAVYGDAHAHIRKEIVGERTVTRVIPLDAEGRLDELAQMLGVTGQAGRETAREMLQQVTAWKRGAEVETMNAER